MRLLAIASRSTREHTATPTAPKGFRYSKDLDRHNLAKATQCSRQPPAVRLPCSELRLQNSPQRQLQMTFIQPASLDLPGRGWINIDFFAAINRRGMQAEKLIPHIGEFVRVESLRVPHPCLEKSVFSSSGLAGSSTDSKGALFVSEDIACMITSLFIFSLLPSYMSSGKDVT
jgi:hypothetical protein